MPCHVVDNTFGERFHLPGPFYEHGSCIITENRHTKSAFRPRIQRVSNAADGRLRPEAITRRLARRRQRKRRTAELKYSFCYFTGLAAYLRIRCRAATIFSRRTFHATQRSRRSPLIRTHLVLRRAGTRIWPIHYRHAVMMAVDIHAVNFSSGA